MPPLLFDLEALAAQAQQGAAFGRPIQSGGVIILAECPDGGLEFGEA